MVENILKKWDEETNVQLWRGGYQFLAGEYSSHLGKSMKIRGSMSTTYIKT